MSSAGSVLAMIQSLRNNRNLVKKRDKLFTGLNKRIAGKYRHHTQNNKQMSEDELNALRQRLIRENRSMLLKRISVLVFIIVSLTIFFLWLNDAVDLDVINERYGFQE